MQSSNSPPSPRSFADVATAGLLAATVALTFWQIVARHVGARLPLPTGLVNVSYTEELGRYLFIWAMLIGAVAAAGRQEHLHLALLERRLGARGRRLLRALRFTAWAGLCLALIIGGVRLLALQWRTQQASAALGWPIVWVTAAIPICAMFLIAMVLRSSRSGST